MISHGDESSFHVTWINLGAYGEARRAAPCRDQRVVTDLLVVRFQPPGKNLIPIRIAAFFNVAVELLSHNEEVLENK